MLLILRAMFLYPIRETYLSLSQNVLYALPLLFYSFTGTVVSLAGVTG